jgi:hypothetical protein
MLVYLPGSYYWWSLVFLLSLRGTDILVCPWLFIEAFEGQTGMSVLRFVLKLGGPKGVEPSTAAFTVRCSARLSYDPQKALPISDCQLPIHF